MRKKNQGKGWSPQEDNLILKFLENYEQTKNWAKIAQLLHEKYNYPKRTGKQCRQRWHNHLDPNITKKPWTSEEEDILFQEHKLHGNKWTLIAEKLPGRNDNSIKNHFYSTIRKGLRRISKIIGSKNPTLKMKKIKPCTLSKIFNLAEDKHQNRSKDSKKQTNFKQMANQLIKFSRLKITSSSSLMNDLQVKNFNQILQQMENFNDVHEKQKKQSLKVKRQRRLEKNFDQASQSCLSEQSQISEQVLEQIFLKRDTSIKRNSQIEKQKLIKNKKVESSSDKRIKILSLPMEVIEQEINACEKQIDHKISQNKGTKIQESEKSEINFSFKQNYESNLINQLNLYPENKETTQDHEGFSQFNIQIQVGIQNQQERIKSKQFDRSPIVAIRVTPFAVTPCYQYFHEHNIQSSSLKVQQFDQTLNKIRNQIRNNNIWYQASQAPSKSIIFQSPSSAFKRPTDSLSKFQSF